MTKTLIEQHPEINGRGIAKEACIKLPKGLHSRPSAKLAQLAQNFKSAISIISEGGEADAKSMLDVLSLALANNASIIILAKGEDAQEAVDEISLFLTKARE